MTQAERESSVLHPAWIHMLMRRNRLQQISLTCRDRLEQRKTHRTRLAKAEGGLHEFGKRGFENRLNFSLNSIIQQQSSDDDTMAFTFELRTLCEMSLSSVFPDPEAENLIIKASDWTDLESSNKYDPFVSLSQPHAAGYNFKASKDMHTVWKVCCDQIINHISSLAGATGHLGADQFCHYYEEAYVWYASHRRITLMVLSLVRLSVTFSWCACY